MALTITHQQRVALVKFLAASFNMAELDSLAFVFAGSSDTFAGNTPTARAREMAEYARRRIQTAELFAAIQTERPKADLRPYGGPGPTTG
ncbi:MAG: hypothetical protein GY803_09655 [Chloroflexi bacterium]|nr:hypothetical protein [Chloroflexota bacterium]